MSTPPTGTTSPPRLSFRNVLVLAVPCVLVIGAAAWYLTTEPKSPDTDYLAQLGDYQKRFGPQTKLDARYADADGDLLADAPTDPAKAVSPATIVFCGLAQDDPARRKEIWADFAAFLAKKTGKKVEPADDVTSPEGQLAALREGKIHVTVFNTGLVRNAVNTAGFVPACCPAREDGSFAYSMELIVPAASPVQKPQDLKGKQVTLSNMSSNAGFKAPVYLLNSQFGLAMNRDYPVNVSGSYQKSVEGIASGRFEAAAVAGDLLERFVSQGKISRDQFRSIYKSEGFPPLCLGYAHDLEPGLAKQVREAMTEFPWAGTSVEKEFKPSGFVKFVPIDYKRDFGFVRSIDDGLQQLAERK